MRRFSLIALALPGLLALGLSPAAAEGGARGRSLSRIGLAVGRALARPLHARPARAIARGAQRVAAVRRKVATKAQQLVAQKRQRRAQSFDRKVRALASSETPAVLRVGRASRHGVELGGARVQQLGELSRELLDGLRELDLKVEDPATGERRLLHEAEVDAALRVAALATNALQDRRVRIAPGNVSLASILAEPTVAAAVLRAAKPADERAFQREYRGAIGALRKLADAYVLQLHWPGIRSDGALAKIATDAAPDLLAVVLRRRAPRDAIAATRALTQRYFKGVTHLWLDPLLAGDAAADRKLRQRLPDAESQQMLDRLVDFRDRGVVRVVALCGGRRSPVLERRVQDALRGVSRTIAGKVLRADYYAHASDKTREGFMRTVAIGAGLGFAMDGFAEATNNPTILKWKPTVLGGWDDAVGGAINAMEMLEVGHGKGVLIDAGAATAVGLSTSVALGTNLGMLGGRSMSHLMLDPATALLPRVLASGLYGVASSGATFTMSFLPARHYRRPILDLVKDGLVEHPVDRQGRPLTGRKLKRWATRNAYKAHLSYSAQKGGLIGVGLSGVLTAGFGVLPAWGGAATANVLLGIGGAAETLTTGGYLFAREALDRRAIARTARAELRRAAQDL